MEQVQAILNPLAPGGAWVMVNTAQLNANTVFPYIIHQFITSSTNNVLQGATDLQNTRVQIDVFSDQASSMQAVANAVIEAMANSGLTNILLTSNDQYESEVRVYRRMLDYSIWSNQ